VYCEILIYRRKFSGLPIHFCIVKLNYMVCAGTYSGGGCLRQGSSRGECSAPPFLEKFIQFSRVFGEKRPNPLETFGQYQKISGNAPGAAARSFRTTIQSAPQLLCSNKMKVQIWNFLILTVPSNFKYGA
jgi:hypothetical protein